MDNRNNNYRSKRNISSRSTSHGEIDRYNYVDRNIYSSSGHGSGPKRRKPKKHRTAKRVAIVLSCIVLVVIAAVGIYAGVMLGRIDRSDLVDPNSYVEQPSEAPAWEPISDENVTNIMLFGMDKGDDGKSHRSDTAILVSIDNKNKQLKMVSFLRDMYLEIPTVGKNKLNNAFSYGSQGDKGVAGGAALTMQTIENHFRVEIDKYVAIDFEGFESLIDRLGGIDIDMSQKAAEYENSIMGSNLKEGVNHLDGRLALYYARLREIDGDFQRTGRQRQVLQAIVTKLKGLNPVEMSSVAYDYLPLVKTNLSNSDLIYLLGIAGPVSNYEMKTMQVPANGTFTENYRVQGIGSTIRVDDIEENARLLREFLYPTTSDSASSEGN